MTNIENIIALSVYESLNLIPTTSHNNIIIHYNGKKQFQKIRFFINTFTKKLIEPSSIQTLIRFVLFKSAVVSNTTKSTI